VLGVVPGVVGCLQVIVPARRPGRVDYASSAPGRADYASSAPPRRAQALEVLKLASGFGQASARSLAGRCMMSNDADVFSAAQRPLRRC
jgi:hypothetical protein